MVVKLLLTTANKVEMISEPNTVCVNLSIFNKFSLDAVFVYEECYLALICLVPHNPCRHISLRLTSESIRSMLCFVNPNAVLSITLLN